MPKTLEKNILPYMEIILNNYSFSNMSLNDLKKMDTKTIWYTVDKELKRLEQQPKKVRDRQLQKMFKKIFSYERTVLFKPSKYYKGKQDIVIDNNRKKSEQRVFADIISTPTFFEYPFVRDFIKNDYITSKEDKLKYDNLLNIIDMYDNLSSEAREKFNYCFRSSSRLSELLLSKQLDIEKVFTEENLSMFSKETLSQIVRFCDKSFFNKYFISEDKRGLFIISELCDYVYKRIGRTSDFLSNIMAVTGHENNFINILNEIYDKYVTSVDEFKKMMNTSLPDYMQELIDEITDRMFIYQSDNITNLEEFMEKRKKAKEENLEFVLSGKPITNEGELKKLQSALFSSVYGITYNEALGIYNKVKDNLYKVKVNDDDKKTLDIIKSIVNICNLSIDDKERIDKVRNVYINYLKKYEINHSSSSFIILDGLLNRMFMHTYNDILFDSNNKSNIQEINGVKVIDAGVNFNMIVTAIDGSIYQTKKRNNFASDWNTSYFDVGQGLCTSFINNQNLGVISLNRPILGFCNLPEDSLDNMGISDLFSHANSLNLRVSSYNRSCYVPGSEMANETRYGYNEMIVDRYLSNDEEDKIKIQPSYVVYYKFDDNRNDKRFLESVQVAKEFGIPIVEIDFRKVQENERREIKMMERELFSNREVDKELLKNILCRYMNNISGTRTIFGDKTKGGLGIKNESSFPFNDLNNFLNNAKRMCKNDDWLNALNDAYQDELRKYEKAIVVKSYKCSIGSDNPEFILDSKYHLGDELEILSNINNFESTITKDRDLEYFVSDSDLTPNTRTLINIVNSLEFSTTYSSYKCNKGGEYGYVLTKRGTEISVEEKLIVAYLTDNYEDDLLVELEKGNYKNINLSEKNKKGSFLEEKINFEKLNNYIDKIENMDDKTFISIFSPYIRVTSNDRGVLPETVAQHFFSKKSDIRNKFNLEGVSHEEVQTSKKSI